MKTCPGENCNSVEGIDHSIECKFEHFQCYSGYFNETKEVQEKIKKAYFDGFDAASPFVVAELESDIFKDMGLDQVSFPTV